MAIKRYPGVYIKEISNLPPSVAQVETAIPAFIGYTEKRVKNGISFAEATPVKITSLIGYKEIFGGAYNEKLTVTLSGQGPAINDSVIKINPTTKLSPYNLYYNLEMYFANGGGPCYIVSVGLYTEFPIPATSSTLIKATELQLGINSVKKVDEITLLVVPEAIELNAGNRQKVYDELLMQCGNLRDRFSILDVLCDSTGTVKSDAANFKNQLGVKNLRYGAAYYPSIKTILELSFKNSDIEILDYRTSGTYSSGMTLNHVLNGATISGSRNLILPDIILYNYILRKIKNEFEIVLHPSAAIAGIYVSADQARGVWKAPANVSLSLVREPSVNISNIEQEKLNVDSASGKSINAIRSFPGIGTLVWGARTLAGNHNEWRYISVIRLFLFVEESLKKSTEFVVFEPNDANTWRKVKSMIENFLTGLWRDGALAGAKPEEAFFVKVGLGETMTARDIQEGRMNIEIGMAAIRPAEFILLKFSHKTLK